MVSLVIGASGKDGTFKSQQMQWLVVHVSENLCLCLVNGKQFLTAAIPFEEFQVKPIICLSPFDASCFPVG